MRFVLANRILLGVGGTEVHLVTIGEHLLRLGHEVALYAPEIGAFAEHARGRGLDVHDSLRELPEDCDVVFAQDAIVAYELAAHYRGALLVFRICGDVFDFQLPPQLVDIVDLVVVLSDRYERVAQAAAGGVPVLRLRMPIDIDRLVPFGSLREEPQRAVILGNYGERDELVVSAWTALGVDVARVGGSVQNYDVAAALADADVVVAKSRAALDAMACGRAVYVFDFLGGDGWVTPELYPLLEADHFAGQATDRIIDRAALQRDLADYRPEMGGVNRDLVLQHHNARDHVVALLAAIGDRAPQQRSPAPLRELSRLVALQWSWEQTARELRARYWPLREHAAQVEAHAARIEAHARQALETAVRERDAALQRATALDEVNARLYAELAAIRATRAWRLITALWRLKARLGR